MKIAVIGSREGFEFGDVAPSLNKYYDPSNPHKNSFISGGARGVDSIVEEYAISLGIPIEIIRPVKPYINSYYLHRNIEIITKADLILAFWDGKSRGTKFVIEYAKARGKEVIIKTLNINKESNDEIN